MNPLLSHALPIVLSLVAKGTVLLIVTWAACALLHRASAATRHGIWTCGLLAVLLLPVLAITLPHWRLAYGRLTGVSSPAAQPPPPPPAMIPSLPTPAAPAPNAAAPTPSGLSSASPVPQEPAPPPAPHAQQYRRFPTTLTLSLLGFVVWLLGSLVLLCRLAIGLRRVGSLQYHAVPLDESTLAVALAAQNQIGLRRRVRFLQAADASVVAVPITWGIWRPVVLLPSLSRDWSTECLRAALLHELAHIQRGDWPTQLLARITCAVNWGHPLVWLAAREARAASEQACDDLVLSTGMAPADYAQQLVEVVRSLPATTKPGVAIAMAQPLEVEGRIAAVLAPGRSRRRLSRRRLALTLGVVAVLLVPLAASSIVPRNPETDQKGLDDATTILLGVSNYPLTRSLWWNKDGHILQSAPAVLAGHSFGKVRAGKNQKVRDFIIQTSGLPTNADISAEIPHSGPMDTTVWSTWVSSRERIKPRGNAFIGIAATLPASDRVCTIRIGVTPPNWYTITSEDKFMVRQGEGVSIASSDGRKVAVTFSAPAKTQGGLAFTISDTISGQETRIVAVDRHGNKVLPNNQSATEAGEITQTTYLFRKIALNDILTLQFQTRPYRWVTFRNIQLQPINALAHVAGAHVLLHPGTPNSLKFLYLKDIVSGGKPTRGRPYKMDQTSDAAGNKPYSLIDVKTGKQYSSHSAEWAKMLRDSPVILTGADVEPQARVVYEPNTINLGTGQRTTRPMIEIHFSPTGTKKIAAFTATHHGDVLAMILDGTLLNAPTIVETISDAVGDIDLGGTPAQVQSIVDRINAAALAPPEKTMATSVPMHSSSVERGEQTLQREGIMRVNDSTRLSMLMAKVSRGKPINDKDLNWAIGLLPETTNSPIPHMASEVAMILFITMSRKHVMPPTQRTEIMTAVTPYTHSSDKVQRGYANTVMKTLRAENIQRSKSR